MPEFNDLPEAVKRLPAKTEPAKTGAAHSDLAGPHAVGNQAAVEIAEKLLQAASQGKNLMKELDYLSSPHAGMPTQTEVLRQMIDSKNDHRNDQQFGNIELLDASGTPVTNRKMSFNIRQIVKTSENGQSSTLYESSFADDARQVYNADKNNILLESKTEAPHAADISKIVADFQKSVDEMIASGHRMSGQGAVMGVINNIARVDFGGKEYDCVDQSIDVLNSLKKLKLNGQWDFHMVGDPPHYTVEVVPHNANDPIIRMDPWRGRDHYQIKQPGEATEDQRLNPWPDDQSKIHWS